MGGAQREAIDKADLLERIDYDRDFLSELVEIFRGDYPRDILAAREAIARGDARAVGRAAHSLKGALSSLSAKAATATASVLEDLGHRGVLDGAGSCLSSLETEIDEVLVSLDAMCREIP
jgi:HPt (histidine-containing phosphotransfer) domain-containing protein